MTVSGQASGQGSEEGEGRARRRGGGRKPGRWVLVRPDEIRAYRRRQGLSRAKLAGLLGVSSTSVQNWERGRVASRDLQRRLRSLFDELGGLPAEGAGEPRAADVAAVVAALVRRSRGLGAEDLLRLLALVRRALEE